MYIHEGLGGEQGGVSGASDRQAEPLALLIKEHHIGSEASGVAACEAHVDWQLLLGNAYQAALWEVKGQRQMLLIRWRPDLCAQTSFMTICQLPAVQQVHMGHLCMLSKQSVL